jgi:hypothetical protein
MGRVGDGVGQPITLSLPTLFEVELAVKICEKKPNLQIAASRQ